MPPQTKGRMLVASMALLVSFALSEPSIAAHATQRIEQAPYGTWRSPIKSTNLARSSVELSDLSVVDGSMHWVESRAEQGGRYIIVMRNAHGRVTELTPAGFNVRTRVHEYGGAPYVWTREATYFSNWVDQRLYVLKPGSAPIALTPPGYRYADCVPDSRGMRLICVREDHTGPGEPRNAIVALSTAGGSAGTVLFDDSDFVAYPRVSADGRRLAWISWNHPNMPWNATTLYVADLTPAGLAKVETVTGDARESVVEPKWNANGVLYFISDRSGWWNLYRWDGRRSEPVISMTAEFARPLWQLGQSDYALTGDGHAVVRYSINARDRLAIIDLISGKLTVINLPFVAFACVQLLSPTTAAAIAMAEAEEPALIAIDLTTGRHRVLRAPEKLPFDKTFTSRAQEIEFPTAGGLTAHALYYSPTNPRYRAPAEEKPPLIVKVHGGPTDAASPSIDLGIQYWTSRGFALLDVNYGGSSGFGREYRHRLDGQWGVVDVQDVVAGTEYLIKEGRVDPKRTAIRGGSAGGFTVLAALAFYDVFAAGANYYGVSDLEALAHETHKFESRYLDSLVAPLPQGRSVYESRAPIRHLEHFHAPLITFQGTEDKIVLPSQSREIVTALKHRNVPVAYLEFAGEQHGFRKADTIIRSVEAELAFYGRVFGFTPADRVAAVSLQ